MFHYCTSTIPQIRMRDFRELEHIFPEWTCMNASIPAVAGIVLIRTIESRLPNQFHRPGLVLGSILLRAPFAPFRVLLRGKDAFQFLLVAGYRSRLSIGLCGIVVLLARSLHFFHLRHLLSAEAKAGPNIGTCHDAMVIPSRGGGRFCVSPSLGQHH